MVLIYAFGFFSGAAFVALAGVIGVAASSWIRAGEIDARWRRRRTDALGR